MVDLNSSRWSRRILALTLLLSLVITGLSLSSYLWDKYRIVKDVQNFYWMARAQDASLFARDYIYLASNTIIPVNLLGFHLLLYPFSFGYGLVFYLSSTVIDYVWLTKLSALALATVGVLYAFKLGQALRDNLTGLSLSLLFTFFILASPQSIAVTTGLQRAFTIPLMIVFLYYMVRQQYPAAGVTMVVSTLIYLPVFPPMVIAYGLSFIKFERPFKLSIQLERGKILAFLGTFVLASFVVASALAVQLGIVRPPPPVLLFPTTEVQVEAPTPSNNAVPDNSQYQSGGSMELFISFPIFGRAGIFDTGADITNFLVMSVLAILIYKLIGLQALQRVPGIVWGLLIGGLGMYALSLFFVLGLSSFALYLPSRYTRSTLFIVMLVVIGVNWVDFIYKLPRWLQRNFRLILFFFISMGVIFGGIYLVTPNRPLLIPLLWLTGLILLGILVPPMFSGVLGVGLQKLSLPDRSRWIALLVSGLLIVMLGLVYIRVLGVKFSNPPQAERDIYEFVATLPKDAVLAGAPHLMEGIPLFAKRSVLFRELFPSTNAPFIEYFEAQYADTPRSMLEFCQRYQVSYVILDKNEFTPVYLSKGDFFYPPWNEEIVKRVAGRSEFALLEIQPIFTSDPFMVIRCDTKTLLY